jgi:hypothetical protein
VEKLVPQPVDASVLVAPPTAEEVEKDEAGGPFYVRHIMAHKVGVVFGCWRVCRLAGAGSVRPGP